MMRLLRVTLFLVMCIICGFIITNSENTGKLYRMLRQYHRYRIDSYYKKRQFWVTSNLGSILFKNKNKEEYGMKKKKKFLIMYWNYWEDSIFRRPNMLADCGVPNCRFSSDLSDVVMADAVIINSQRGKFPNISETRPLNQRWIFFTDESPVNMCSLSLLRKYANKFNWTMTYRSDSDIPVPYGRTVPLTTTLIPSNMSASVTSLIPNWEIKQRNVLMVSMMSHCCVKDRNNYIKQLKRYLKVDVYGICSYNHKNSCPGNAERDCPLINNYLFYLAFENSKCRQYITEKTFYNSYSKGSIPIIMGAPKLDCEKILPPHSFLHVKDFQDPKSLADEVKRLARNINKLLMYHQWRRFFKVTNEHGFFGTHNPHLCRVCEALNYNEDTHKVYSEDDLRIFAESALLCEQPIFSYGSCNNGNVTI